MLDVDHLTLKLNQHTILNDIHFKIAPGSVVSVIGRSGAGKSSLLRCVAGLEHYDGHIHFQDQTLNTLTPGERHLGYVEQQLTLFPHLTIADNIAYPLQLRRQSAQLIRQQVKQLLERCALTHCAQRWPHEVSGGEQRRAMLARVLIYQPSLILFDEPFSAVDALTRVALVRWLKTELQERQITALYVTHDIAEAQFMSERAVILDQGRLLAYDTWEKLSTHSPFVRELLQTQFSPLTQISA